MREFCQTAYDSAQAYYDYLKNASKGGSEISVRNIENIGKMKFRLLISKKIFSVDAVELRIRPLKDGFDLEPDDVNIVEYNESKLYIVVIASPRAYAFLTNCRPQDLFLFSDMTFLVKALQKFYGQLLHADGSLIPYPLAPVSFPHIKYPVNASDEQRQAIHSVLANPISYVWGAPGTGKTQMVLANAMIQYVNADKSVLLLAPTNAALEQSLRGVLAIMDKNGTPLKKIIRLGKATSEFLRDYPEVCEASHYESATDAMTREIDQLRAMHMHQTHCKSTLEKCQEFSALELEYRALAESLGTEQSLIDELNAQLSVSRTKLDEYAASADSLSSKLKFLKETAAKQERYFLFFRHYAKYRKIIEEYQSDVKRLTDELREAQRSHASEVESAARLQAELSEKIREQQAFIRRADSVQKKAERLLSQQKKTEHQRSLNTYQREIDALASSLDAKQVLVEQLSLIVAAINEQLKEVNSIKVGHPALFEISNALYGKVLPFDELSSALTKELESFSDFHPRNDLETEIASTAQLYDDAVSSFGREDQIMTNLQDQKALKDFSAGDLKAQADEILQKISEISCDLFSESLSVVDLTSKIDELAEALKDFAYDDTLPDLIAQKVEEYENSVVKLKDILCEKNVFACTLDYAVIHLDTIRSAYKLYHVFVDEVAYCPLIKAGVFFSLGIPVAMFGDHMQLPPICEMKRKDITNATQNQSIFMFDMSAIHFADLYADRVSTDTLYQAYVTNTPPTFACVDVTFLTKTFRFGQRLAAVLDHHVYHRGFHGEEGTQTKITVINVPKGNQKANSRINLAEATAIKQYLSENTPGDYAILAPYRDQCHAIEKELRLPVDSVLTVHKVQGREWDTVILSVTDTINPFFMGNAKGLRIINTAVSRARRHLVLVMDYECWKHAEGELITDIANIYYGIRPNYPKPAASAAPPPTFAPPAPSTPSATKKQPNAPKRTAASQSAPPPPPPSTPSEDHAITALNTLFGESVIKNLVETCGTGRLLRAYDEKFTIDFPARFEKIKIHSGSHMYETDLTSCSCDDYQRHTRPCKHMIWLAAQFGLFQLRKDDQDQFISRMQNEVRENEKNKDAAKKDRAKAAEHKKHADEKLSIIAEASVEYPHLSKLLARYDDEVDKLREAQTGKNAPKACETVAEIRREKRAMINELNRLRSTITVYESLFPWLTDLKSLDIDKIKTVSEYISADDDYSTFLRRFLTPDQYSTFSPEEKLMSAVEQCCKIKKAEKTAK